VSCGRGGGGSETEGGRAAAVVVRTRSTWAADGWAPMVTDFSNLFKTGLTLKIKMGALTCPKIPNFCMWLAWDIVNNFLNCTNIKFPTKEYLKILE
jgi:hypothetical protein